MATFNFTIYCGNPYSQPFQRSREGNDTTERFTEPHDALAYTYHLGTLQGIPSNMDPPFLPAAGNALRRPLTPVPEVPNTHDAGVDELSWDGHLCEDDSAAKGQWAQVMQSSHSEWADHWNPHNPRRPEFTPSMPGGAATDEGFDLPDWMVRGTIGIDTYTKDQSMGTKEGSEMANHNVNGTATEDPVTQGTEDSPEPDNPRDFPQAIGRTGLQTRNHPIPAPFWW
ncbi:MAG: hypothetical protein LQ340_000927 [Diploschistes diacapsis]|nr:MAG: hypothetical protein LQ340_000927 [Diploschistes diacapsis]